MPTLAGENAQKVGAKIYENQKNSAESRRYGLTRRIVKIKLTFQRRGAAPSVLPVQKYM